MRWGILVAALVCAPSLAFAGGDFFRLPSYVSAQGGLGKDHYQDMSLNLGLSLPGNWQIEAGADKTVTQGSDSTGDDIVTRGWHFGGGTDPLRLLSGRVSVEGWTLDNVEARGGRVGLVVAPGLWTFSFEFIGQEMKFSSLPLAVNRSREETVKDSGFSLRVSTMAVKNWNFFIAGTAHTYDHDLSRLYDIPALVLNRMPATVLTTLTGLNKSDASLGATYLFRKWDVGIEGGRSISAVDGVKTRRLGLNAMLYFNRKWSFGLSTMTYKPEDAEESSDTSHATSATVTFKW